jgi:hypothetical protein
MQLLVAQQNNTVTPTGVVWQGFFYVENAVQHDKSYHANAYGRTVGPARPNRSDVQNFSRSGYY